MVEELSDTNSINFGAFSDESVGKSKYIKTPSWVPDKLKSLFTVLAFMLFSLLIFGFVLFILPFLVLLGGMLYIYNIFYFLAYILLISLIIFVLFKLIFRERTKKGKKDPFKQFAQDNGWGYGPAGKVIGLSEDSNIIQMAKSTGAEYYSINGVYKDHKFELLLGWKDQEFKDSAIELEYGPSIYIQSKKKLPNAVLVSLSLGDSGTLFDRMYVKYENPQLINLEGDFNKYFRLYSPDREHIEALSLIAPDFMATLVDYCDDFSLLMSGQIFSLHSTGGKGWDMSSVGKIFEAVDKIVSETEY